MTFHHAEEDLFLLHRLSHSLFLFAHSFLFSFVILFFQSILFLSLSLSLSLSLLLFIWFYLYPPFLFFSFSLSHYFPFLSLSHSHFLFHESSVRKSGVMKPLRALRHEPNDSWTSFFLFFFFFSFNTTRERTCSRSKQLNCQWWDKLP